LPLRLRPIDFGSPAGNWMLADGEFTHEPQSPSEHPLRGTAFAAAWIVASLASIAGCDVERVDYYDAREATAPAGALVRWLAERVGAPLRSVDPPPGVAAVAIAGDLLLANTASAPCRVSIGHRTIELAADETVVIPRSMR